MSVWVLLSLLLLAAPVRTVTVSKRFLMFPVRPGAPKVRMALSVEGVSVDDFDLELDAAAPANWMAFDVGRWRGQKVALTGDGVEAIKEADEIPNLYHEALRPQFHFSARRGWLNDPNGLVFANGEYHLFFQHNPFGTSWGNMHWGHAISKDLVHWVEQPEAIFPHSLEDGIWSGSAVVDTDNTAGFGKGAMVAAFASPVRGECIAYMPKSPPSSSRPPRTLALNSLPRLRGRGGVGDLSESPPLFSGGSLEKGEGGVGVNSDRFIEYPGNPVVKHVGRDPKVIWYAPEKKWAMAVYDERDGSHGIAFYDSHDLKSWNYLSRIDGFYECPELFEIPLDGNKKNTKWVIYAGDGAYRVGKFDGHAFTPETEKIPLAHGQTFYASQTYNGIPAKDGRRIQIAWGRIDFPGMPFNQQMLFPVSLTLHTTPSGPRLFAYPVKEIEKLWGPAMDLKKMRWGSRPAIPADRENQRPLRDELTVTPDHPLEIPLPSRQLDISLTIDLDTSASVTITPFGVPITYDGKSIECSGVRAPLAPEPASPRLTLRLLIDTMSIEVFAGDGQVYLPLAANLTGATTTLGIHSSAQSTMTNLTIRALKSTWFRQSAD
jgi:fructan beta-fructosidase